MKRQQKVGPPRRPAAQLYTIPELDALQHQLTLKGCTGIVRHIQDILLDQEPMFRATHMLYWRDDAGRDWVAHAR